MTAKEYFKSLSLKDIREFVDQQIPEDLNLEFKTANFPLGRDFDDKNFSKCLSGFSNSSGGILVWGIDASKNKDGVDAAKSLKPIKDFLKFENHLKRMEGKAVEPLIEGVEYKTIKHSRDDGFILVLIPQSERAPHMAQFADKHYYKRSGDSFYICEHFDIIDMINRRIIPDLSVELQNVIVQEKVNRGPVYYRIYGIICIRNIGQTSAKHIELHVRVKHPYRISDYGIDGNRNRGMKMIPSRQEFYKYMGGVDIVLHPETCIEVDKIVLNEISHDDQIEDLFLEYKVMAEGMKIKSGEIRITLDNLIKKSSD